MQENFDHICKKMMAASTSCEFSELFEKVINIYQLTLPEAIFLKWLGIARYHKKPEIFMPQGVKVLQLLLAEQPRNFIENEQGISLEQLQCLEFSFCPPNVLGIIKQKIHNFITSKIKENSPNSDVWDKLDQMLLELNDCQEPTVFRKISKLKLLLSLVTLIDKPYIIAQPGHTNLCGPAAVLTYIFSEMPDQFITAVETFFNKGEVDKPFKMLASSNSKNHECRPIVAMMMAMKHASNYWLGYSSPLVRNRKLLETYCGLTEPKQMLDWLQDLGCGELYEDVSICVPFTNYRMPEFVANVLLWRQAYSIHHKTVVQDADRMPILEDFIKNVNYKKIILLFCQNFWSNVKHKYFAHNLILNERASKNRLRANIGHYVYLHSLRLTVEDQFEFVFYGDGKLIEITVDKAEFLRGLKGMISMVKPLAKQQLTEQPAKKRTIC